MQSKVMLFIALFLVILSGCKRDNTVTEQSAPKPVKIETVSGSYQNETLVFNGKIKEKSLTTLSFRVGGPLSELNVETGDYVKEGQLIAAIDKRDYRIQLQSTQTQLKQLEGEYKRYKELYEEDKLPANTYEKIESGYLMAKTAYENALNQLNDTELRAPFSGYIYEKKTENFQTVGPGQSIVSIIDVSQLEVVIAVSENQINNVQLASGSSFLEVKNANVSRLPLRIESIGKKAKNDGLYEVRLSFNNTDDLNVTPGMTASVTMQCDSESNPINIPASALFNDGNSTCVWVYNPKAGNIEKRSIQTEQFGPGGRIVVSEGISAGESIITAGIYDLTNGQAVTPIQSPSATNIGGLL